MLVKLRYLILISIVAIAIVTASMATAQSNYLQQGKQYYDRGQYSQAVIVWQQVIEEDREIENKIIGYNYQAIAFQDLGEYTKSEKALQLAFKLLENNDNSFLQAQLLNSKGSLEYRTGKYENALATWKQAETIYRDLEEVEPLLRSRSASLIARSQINQAQALRSLGYYRRAKNILETANNELEALPNSALKVKSLQSLG
ncbi:MAG: hypothetical protein AAF383_05895 [Cyanobacteria bacterium P01_A01_bin.83]